MSLSLTTHLTEYFLTTKSEFHCSTRTIVLVAQVWHRHTHHAAVSAKERACCWEQAHMTDCLWLYSRRISRIWRWASTPWKGLLNPQAIALWVKWAVHEDAKDVSGLREAVCVCVYRPNHTRELSQSEQNPEAMERDVSESKMGVSCFSSRRTRKFRLHFE